MWGGRRGGVACSAREGGRVIWVVLCGYEKVAGRAGCWGVHVGVCRVGGAGACLLCTLVVLYGM